jgi:hypothetical protein
MADWASNTCGQCSFDNSPDTLEKFVCPECGREMCHVCANTTANSPMCSRCAWDKVNNISDAVRAALNETPTPPT